MLKWQWAESNGINYITIPEWEKQGLAIMFSSRHQGVSRPPFDSLNLALHVGDELGDVLFNRQKLIGVWQRSLEDMVCCEQVHGNRVAVVDETARGRGAIEYADALPGCDSLVTDQAGLYLTLFYADCVPIFLFDPVRRVIGLVHSGWKGTMGKIAWQAVEQMQQRLGVEPQNIQAFIGPGIARCCFAINEELADKVGKEFAGFDNILAWQEDKYFWDLSATNFQLLKKIGLQEKNIAVCELCTSCETDRFFSYRSSGGKTGRMAALIALP